MTQGHPSFVLRKLSGLTGGSIGWRDPGIPSVSVGPTVFFCPTQKCRVPRGRMCGLGGGQGWRVRRKDVGIGIIPIAKIPAKIDGRRNGVWRSAFFV